MQIEGTQSRKPHSGRESGQVIVFLVLALIVLLGAAALVIDIGYAYYAKRTLQASADAAALAGAQELPDAGLAEAYALDYSGKDGAKNEKANVPGVQTTVATRCGSFAPCNPVNSVVVRQSVQLPTKFARLLGFDTFTINARATACSPCGARPLDIMLVLDRTGSMCQNHWGNPDPACTDLQNAKEGLRTFIDFMDPAIDKIGLAVFPPAFSTGSRCGTPQSSYYNNPSRPYVLVQMSQDYKVDGELNENSQLVSTVDCLRGNGTTAYATAIEKAQGELDARGRADAQDIIVFFSDGAANTGPTYYSSSSPYRTRPCGQGVTSAGTIKSRETLIYSIGYDLDALNGGANRCQNGVTGANESPAITAYAALQQMASSDETFFNQPGPGELETIYTAVAAEISGSRLIADGLIPN